MVAVVIGGRPLNLEPLLAHCRAVLHSWYPGQEGGTAIAAILFGDTNPSGKLPISLARSAGQIPMHIGKRASAYRGYLFSPQEPVFPFGHGLSYTSFAYGEPVVHPTVIEEDQEAEVRVEVTNTGDRRGTEVVQCYVYDRVASVARPRRQLCGFARVELDPGETKTVGFRIESRHLELVDLAMTRTVEPGEFELHVGGSSAATKMALLNVRNAATGKIGDGDTA